VVGVVDEQHIAEAHANHLPNQFPALASNNDRELNPRYSALLR